MTALPDTPTPDQARFATTRPLDLPPAVKLGLEFRRRGIDAPAGVAALTAEYQRRGYIGSGEVTPQAADVLGGQRLGQIKDRREHVGNEDQRYRYTRERTDEWFRAQEAAYAQTPAFEQQWQQLPAAVRLTQPKSVAALPYAQRQAFRESLYPVVDQRQEKFGKEFDDQHTPEAELLRQRETASEYLLENFRQARPDASDSEAYDYMHRELARQGYSPAGVEAADAEAGGLVDKRALLAKLEAIERGDGTMVSRAVGGVRDTVPYVGDLLAGGAGAVPRGLAGVMEMGAFAAEAALGLDSGPSAGSKQIGDAGERLVKSLGLDRGTPEQTNMARRFAFDLGTAIGDIALVVATRNPKAASRMAAVLPGAAYFGGREAAGMSRQAYDAYVAKGLDPRSAQLMAGGLGVAAGTMTAVLERVPLTAYFEPAKRSRLNRALTGMLAEGTTEAAQEMANVALAVGADVEDMSLQDALGRIAYAGAVGAAAGGASNALIPDSARIDTLENAARGNKQSKLMLALDDVYRTIHQRAEGLFTPGSRTDEEGKPTETQEAVDAAGGAGTAAGGTSGGTSGGETAVTPPSGGEDAQGRAVGRSDPKVLATAKHAASWYAKTYNDPSGAEAIGAAVEQAGERLELIDVPLDMMQTMVLQESDLDQGKVQSISQLSEQEVMDLPPAIAIGEPGGGLAVMDGTHRVEGLRAGGQSPTIRAYVPASIAAQIKAGPPPSAVSPETQGPGGVQIEPGGEGQAVSGESGPAGEVDAGQTTPPSGQDTAADGDVSPDAERLADYEQRLIDDDTATGDDKMVPRTREIIEAEVRRLRTAMGQSAASPEAATDKPPDAGERPSLGQLKGAEPEAAIEQARARGRVAREGERLGTGRHSVSIEDLTPGSAVSGVKISPERVAHWVKAAHRKATPLQVVEEADGALVVQDGNHRLLAAAIAGDAGVQIVVQRSEAGKKRPDQGEQSAGPDGSETGVAPDQQAESDADKQGPAPSGREMIEGAEATLAQLRESVDALSRQARTNPLTGGLNRAEFDRLMDLAAQEADQSGDPFAVIAFDAANLKSVNDTQGDAAGDAYLKATYEAIAAVTRDGTPGSSDAGGKKFRGRRADAFHYGGDEFAILLTGLPAGKADEIAARVRDQAEAAVAREEVVPGVSTFLVGEPALYKPGQGDTAAVLAQATDAMKARKKRIKGELGEATTREAAEQAQRDAADTDKTGTTAIIAEGEELAAASSLIAGARAWEKAITTAGSLVRHEPAGGREGDAVEFVRGTVERPVDDVDGKQRVGVRADFTVGADKIKNGLRFYSPFDIKPALELTRDTPPPPTEPTDGVSQDQDEAGEQAQPPEGADEQAQEQAGTQADQADGAGVEPGDDRPSDAGGQDAADAAAVVEAIGDRGTSGGASGGEAIGSPMPSSGKVPPPEGSDDSAPEVPLAAGWGNQVDPPSDKGGKVFRTGADKPKAVRRSALAARARAQRDKAAVDVADSVYSIIRDLSRRLGAGPPGKGRGPGLGTRAAGFIRPFTHDIRLHKGSYIGTQVHELGHLLHKLLFAPRGARIDIKSGQLDHLPKEIKAELLAMGKEIYPDRKPSAGYKAEGWAEAVRMLVIEPRSLRKAAPKTYQLVTMKLKTEHPETWAALLDARIRLRNAIRLAEINPVDQYIDHDAAGTGYNARTLYDDFRIRAFDRYHRLVTMKQDLGLEGVGPQRDPHRAALRVRGHTSGDVKVMMHNGTFDPADLHRTPTGPSMETILAPVMNNLRMFQGYLVARRAIEKRAQGFDVFPQDFHLPDMTSNAKLQQFIDRAEQEFPEFATAREQFQAFNQWLVGDYAVHYGLIDSDTAKVIIDRNLEYVTFRTKKTDDALLSKIAGAAKRFVNTGSGIGRFNPGRGEQIFPPLESFYSSLEGIVSRAHNNQAGRSVLRIATDGIPGAGRWVSEITRPVDAQRVTADDLRGEIGKQLGISVSDDGAITLPPYLEGLSDEQLDSLVRSIEGIQSVTLWKAGMKTDAERGEVSVLIGGKPKFFEIKDKRLFDLLEGLGSPSNANVLVRVLGFPSRLLRMGATQKNPSFGLANLTRDLFQAVTMTETDLAKLNQQRRLRLEGMRAAFFGGKWYDLFLASGADMSGLYAEPAGKLFDRRQKLERMFEKSRYGLLKGDTAAAMLKDLVTLGPLDRFNSSLEMAVRIGELATSYTQQTGAGVDPGDALLNAGQAAADVTLDFERGGTWAKDVNQIIPFFNAAMLGADKQARFIKANPIKALGRIVAVVILPSIISQLMNWDNEDYWAKPLGMRDRYWYFPTGEDDRGRKTYLRLPKPYGLGAFAVVYERLFASLFAIDPITGERGDPGTLRGFGEGGIVPAVLNEFRPALNLAGVLPLLEVNSGEQGYSFWRNNEIVSAADKDLPAGLQGATRSSDVARVLGSWLDYPPAKIDYLVSGFFGGLGRDIVSTAVDPVIRAVDPEAKRGEPLTFSDWLVVRRFISGGTRADHEAISRFYNEYEHLRRVQRGLSVVEDQPEKAERYRQERRAELALYPAYASTQRRIGQHFKELRGLYRQRGEIDADVFEARVDDLYGRIINESQQIQTQTREAKE